MANTPYAVSGKFVSAQGDDFVHYTNGGGSVLCYVDSLGVLHAAGNVSSAVTLAGSTINGLTTAGMGAPPILASSTSANLLYSAFAAIQLLATGHAAGTYRITISATVKTTITTATSWLFTAAYTDAIHSQTPTVCTSSTMTANATEQGSITFFSAGTAAITITPTAASSDGGAIAYTAILERLA